MAKTWSLYKSQALVCSNAGLILAQVDHWLLCRSCRGKLKEVSQSSRTVGKEVHVTCCSKDLKKSGSVLLAHFDQRQENTRAEMIHDTSASRENLPAKARGKDSSPVKRFLRCSTSCGVALSMMTKGHVFTTAFRLCGYLEPL